MTWTKLNNSSFQGKLLIGVGYMEEGFKLNSRSRATAGCPVIYLRNITVINLTDEADRFTHLQEHDTEI